MNAVTHNIEGVIASQWKGRGNFEASSTRRAEGGWGRGVSIFRHRHRNHNRRKTKLIIEQKKKSGEKKGAAVRRINSSIAIDRYSLAQSRELQQRSLRFMKFWLLLLSHDWHKTRRTKKTKKSWISQLAFYLHWQFSWRDYQPLHQQRPILFLNHPWNPMKITNWFGWRQIQKVNSISSETCKEMKTCGEWTFGK